MMRRKFTKDFKFEALTLVTHEEDQKLIRDMNSPTIGGVAVAQAARDLELAVSVLRDGCGRPQRHLYVDSPGMVSSVSSWPRSQTQHG